MSEISLKETDRQRQNRESEKQWHRETERERQRETGCTQGPPPTHIHTHIHTVIIIIISDKRHSFSKSIVSACSLINTYTTQGTLSATTSSSFKKSILKLTLGGGVLRHWSEQNWYGSNFNGLRFRRGKAGKAQRPALQSYLFVFGSKRQSRPRHGGQRFSEPHFILVPADVDDFESSHAGKASCSVLEIFVKFLQFGSESFARRAPLRREVQTYNLLFPAQRLGLQFLTSATD